MRVWRTARCSAAERPLISRSIVRLASRGRNAPMLIVDAQIHLWEKGTPSAHHRQEPYSAEQAIAAMDEAGVDRALIHPVLWDPDWNERPGMLGLRFYTNERHPQSWFTDGTLDWLWRAAERAQVPLALGAAM